MSSHHKPLHSRYVSVIGSIVVCRRRIVTECIGVRYFTEQVCQHHETVSTEEFGCAGIVISAYFHGLVIQVFAVYTYLSEEPLLGITGTGRGTQVPLGCTAFAGVATIEVPTIECCIGSHDVIDV